MLTSDPFEARLGGGGMGCPGGGAGAVGRVSWVGGVAYLGLMTRGGGTRGLGRVGVSVGVSVCFPDRVVTIWCEEDGIW